MAPTQKAPVVVNLGKSSRKRIKKLKRGEGNLMDNVLQRLARLKTSGEVSTNAEAVVFIVERRAELSMPSMPSMPWLPIPKRFSMR
ncbi:MAG: hypothetical protein JO328_02540 [Hyphomicrobiales bacterium]|nr:hypothetical protein [Hyphomicrobiales bacterium]